MITGLIPGMSFSAGTAVGTDGWRVRAVDFADIWIGPPLQFVGMVDLMVELHLAEQIVVDRWLLRLEWDATNVVASVNPPTPTPTPAPRADLPPMAQLDTDLVVVASQPEPVVVQSAPVSRSQTVPNSTIGYADHTIAASIPAVSSKLVAGSVTPQVDPNEIAFLIERGKGLIAGGDVAAARLALRRAAESRDAEAALMLGSTYDPAVLRELRVYGFAADIELARFWYEKAKEFGVPEATRRLEVLARGTR
jgi:hypothetical protein